MAHNFTRNTNIVLIGMPAVGKSTIGVLLAKFLSKDFVDVDVLIQRLEGQRLQSIIESQGLDAFCCIEQNHVLALNCHSTVIATGGSVIYGQLAMQHLKENGIIVLLDLDLALLEQRLSDLDSRGVVHAPGQSLRDIWTERMPLYRVWADLTIDCAGLNHQQVVSAICKELENKPPVLPIRSVGPV